MNKVMILYSYPISVRPFGSPFVPGKGQGKLNATGSRLSRDLARGTGIQQENECGMIKREVDSMISSKSLSPTVSIPTSPHSSSGCDV